MRSPRSTPRCRKVGTDAAGSGSSESSAQPMHNRNEPFSRRSRRSPRNASCSAAACRADSSASRRVLTRPGRPGFENTIRHRSRSLERLWLAADAVIPGSPQNPYPTLAFG